MTKVAEISIICVWRVINVQILGGIVFRRALVHKNGYLTNQAVLLKVFLVVKGVRKHLLLNI